MRVKQRLSIIMLLLLLGGNISIFAQKQNNIWVFGYNHSLNFNTTPPTPLYDPNIDINQDEGSTSVCDQNSGELLFYTDGDTVWNANYKPMPNGAIDAIMTNSGTQAAAIVPMPNRDSLGKYYVFSEGSLTYDLGGWWPGIGTLFYSVVDMNLDGGLGDIVPGRKKIYLDSGNTEAIAAIPGNNCDYWIVVHSEHGNIFKAFHVTASGVDATPVLSSTGFSFSDLIAGIIKVSPDHQKLAILDRASSWGVDYPFLQLFDFDPVTGQVSNPITIDSIDNCSSVEFSPNSLRLYGQLFAGWSGLGLFQWDLSSGISATILASRTYISDTMGGSNASILLGPDEKIYTSPCCYLGYLGVINNPDAIGTACNYVPLAIPVGGNHFPYEMSGEVSHNWVPSLPLWDTSSSTQDTLVCSIDSSMKLSAASGFDHYNWDDGSTDSIRDITATGTYYVLCQNACHTQYDTFVVKVADFTFPMITIDVRTLSTTVSYSTYQWLLNGNIIPGATQSNYTVTENGNYQVIVSNELGCTDTSAIYKVTNVTGILINHLEDQIKIYPNPANAFINISSPVAVNLTLYSVDGRILKQAQKENRITVQNLAKGVYFLYVYDQQENLLKVEKIVK